MVGNKKMKHNVGNSVLCPTMLRWRRMTASSDRLASDNL